MNVLLVYPAPPASNWPKGAFRSRWVPTGLACIAAALTRAGHRVQVHLAEEALERNGYDRPAARGALRDAMAKLRPEMVGLSLVTSGVEEGKAVAEDAKALLGAGTLIVAGGPHPTALGEQLLDECPAIDAAVLGEGERTIVELASAGPSPAVRGIVLRGADGRAVRTPDRPPEGDLDSLGPPAYELFDMDHFTAPSRWLVRYLKLRATNIRTSRGCTSRCRFCAGYLVAGIGVRYHSVPYVIEQMRQAVRRWGIEAVHFEDDSLGCDRGRLLRLCEAIRQADLHRRLRWDACLRVDQADAELLREMKAAGCIQIEYGLESGSTASLRRLGKNTDVDQNRRAVELTRQAGLRIFADIMVGLPGETVEDFRSTLSFLRWARPDILSPARLCPLPGTAIFNGLSASQRAGIDWGDGTYPDAQAHPINLTAMPDGLMNKLYRRFYKYVARPHTIRAMLRDTPAADLAARRKLRRKLLRFILHHPLRAIRVPW